MAKPKRVGHLVLNVKDQTEATKFYTEVLGFEISVERPGLGPKTVVFLRSSWNFGWDLYRTIQMFSNVFK